MPDEIVCPACGRANPARAKTCVNCATAFSARLLQRPAEESAWRREQAEHEATYAAELGTVQDGAWREVSTETRSGGLPLPPQVRAEALRREREFARRESEQKAANRLREERDRILAERAALIRSRKTKRVCTQCGTATPTNLGETGDGNFTFCLNCGMSFDAASETQTPEMGMAETMPPAPAQTVTSPVGVLRQQARRELRSDAGARTVVVGGANEVLPMTETTPYVAAILSFLLPGVGQIRNGQFAKGCALLVAVCVALSMLHVGMWSLTALILRGLLALDAFRIAERKRHGDKIGTWQWDIVS